MPASLCTHTQSILFPPREKKKTPFFCASMGSPPPLTPPPLLPCPTPKGATQDTTKKKRPVNKWRGLNTFYTSPSKITYKNPVVTPRSRDCSVYTQPNEKNNPPPPPPLPQTQNIQNTHTQQQTTTIAPTTRPRTLHPWIKRRKSLKGNTRPTTTPTKQHAPTHTRRMFFLEGKM